MWVLGVFFFFFFTAFALGQERRAIGLFSSFFCCYLLWLGLSLSLSLSLFLHLQKKVEDGGLDRFSKFGETTVGQRRKKRKEEKGGKGTFLLPLNLTLRRQKPRKKATAVIFCLFSFSVWSRSVCTRTQKKFFSFAFFLSPSFSSLPRDV